MLITGTRFATIHSSAEAIESADVNSAASPPRKMFATWIELAPSLTSIEATAVPWPVGIADWPWLKSRETT